MNLRWFLNFNICTAPHSKTLVDEKQSAVTLMTMFNFTINEQQRSIWRLSSVESNQRMKARSDKSDSRQIKHDPKTISSCDKLKTSTAQNNNDHVCNRDGMKFRKSRDKVRVISPVSKAQPVEKAGSDTLSSCSWSSFWRWVTLSGIKLQEALYANG